MRGLAISGTFDINDTEHTLRVLEKSLPITLSFISKYWLMTLMTLARILVAALAGIIIKLSNYTSLFLLLSFAMLGVTYLSWVFANKTHVFSAKTP
jgi:hypothetical protein